jgi:hypothetical protein
VKSESVTERWEDHAALASLMSAELRIVQRSAPDVGRLLGESLIAFLNVNAEACPADARRSPLRRSVPGVPTTTAERWKD